MISISNQYPNHKGSRYEMKPKIIRNGSPRCINAVLTNVKDSILIALEMQIVSTFHKQNDSPQLSFTFCKA